MGAHQHRVLDSGQQDLFFPPPGPTSLRSRHSSASGQVRPASGINYLQPSRTSNEDLIALLGQFSDDESITTVEEVVQALERRGLKEEQSFWTILESLVEVCKALITIGGGVISVGGGLLAIKAAMDS